MKKIIIQTSIILNLIFVLIFLFQLWSPLKSDVPNKVAFFNNSGEDLSAFKCTYFQYSYYLDSFHAGQSIEFQFESDTDSHLELEWFLNGSIQHRNYGYYTSTISVNDSAEIDSLFQVVSIRDIKPL